jgi:chromosome segregation ATPase
MPDFSARGRQALGITDDGQADPSQGTQVVTGTTTADPATPPAASPSAPTSRPQGQESRREQGARRSQPAPAGLSDEAVRELAGGVAALVTAFSPVNDALPIIDQIPDKLERLLSQFSEDGPLGKMEDRATRMARRARAFKEFLEQLFEQEERNLAAAAATENALAHARRAVTNYQPLVEGNGQQIRDTRRQLDELQGMFEQFRTDLGEARTEVGQFRVELRESRALLGQLLAQAQPPTS